MAHTHTTLSLIHRQTDNKPFSPSLRNKSFLGFSPKLRQEEEYYRDSHYRTFPKIQGKARGLKNHAVLITSPFFTLKV
jgi:hypothetical protein